MSGRKKKNRKPSGDDSRDSMYGHLIEDDEHGNGYDSGTEEEQEAFKQRVKAVYKEKGFVFKHPKFYQEEVNLLKLWRVVKFMGGSEHVTSSKLWRQVGELFNPPNTCTTVAFAFRCIYQKALLEYEDHKPLGSNEAPHVNHSYKGKSKVPKVNRGSQIAPRPCRPPRNSAIRAKKVWQSLRDPSDEADNLLVSTKNKESVVPLMRQKKNEKELKMSDNICSSKHPNEPHFQMRIPKDEPFNNELSEVHKKENNFKISDIGTPADWVKINVFTTTDGFEVFALIPGLSREEVQIQYDQVGHIVISGQPENPYENPWGIFPFKKVIKLASRINPHKTTAVVTLHGQLFIRAPFEQSNS